MIPNRIVIDTNVCLDLFVFRDPRWDSLVTALRDGTVEAVTRADCRMEWLIVLGYAQLKLDDTERQRSMAEFDAAIRCLPDIATDTATVRLPVCKDRDDQKFLELARDAKASVLITKDKALLKLASKTRRSGLFLILKPESWIIPAPLFKGITTNSNN
ncbi:putative toxin-antitoxin system toxin component, PIN family [Actimicrobium sp. CCC2.4]|uniref:putative toxin-antitoxin system toxin component, PIN family n=1 Tax=Actimicrobium sp. CCC2.4 TaxID=3048606 RepID=UPI002AC9BF3C|nr:putative toxin-antitoxin system toxin component, PIN family [Actimicrobium sp. CCC2.4]MEB0134853.1 putative toxin-antitoxin system toxin component, PIN family [Actimicrobium sp. CCC2.4]WPX30785.1 putative toxin-antitoxin system toxin component, PIN family [Actimicrobium sp. CCC2.4]